MWTPFRTQARLFRGLSPARKKCDGSDFLTGVDTKRTIVLFSFLKADDVMERNQWKGAAIMHTRKASFRLPVVIICFAAVLGMVSCLDSKPWKNPCRKGGTTTTAVRPSDER